jgi:hypothetical protein
MYIMEQAGIPSFKYSFKPLKESLVGRNQASLRSFKVEVYKVYSIRFSRLVKTSEYARPLTDISNLITKI